MFLHIGNSKIVFNEELIGIFNLDSQAAQVNECLLESASYDALYHHSLNDQPKSFIVADRKVFMSPISPLTLFRRHNSSG